MWLLLKITAAKQFVFIDESGMNREYRRLYARAKRGVKIIEKVPGKRVKRTNIIAGLVYGNTAERYIAMQCYDHSTTSRFFEDWFEFELIPEMPRNSIAIMDNASFHRKQALINIAQRYGVSILFLPPYSPQFNPIEHSWANFKRWIADNSRRFPSLQIAAGYYFSLV